MSREVAFEVRELADDHAEFVLRGTTLPVANALRRVMLEETPCFAIDRVVIHSNTTTTTDELIAQRLGLLPVQCDEHVAHSSGQVEFELKVRRETPLGVVVTSLHLRSKGFLLARIELGQELHVTAYARQGIGAQHARWCATTALSMQPEPVIDVDQGAWGVLPPAAQHAFISAIPAGFFACTPARGGLLRAANALAIAARKDDVLRAAATIVQSAGGGARHFLTIDTSPDFIFRFETTGALTPINIVLSATRVLHAKFEGLSALLTRDMDA